MPSLLPRRLDRRTVPVLLVAGALVVSAGVGGATAGALITGRDIADRSITSTDIANRTIGTSQISKEAMARLRTRWSAGSGSPRNQSASTGTWYLDKATGDAYKKTARGWEFRVNIMGATGAPGAVGPQGANGGAGANGAKGDAGAKGDPGAQGDAGAKGDAGEAGAKGETGNVGATGARGDSGEAGSAWLRGAGVPSAAIGAVGDWYLDSTSYDAYQKDADSWVVVLNLRGPVGPKGDVGATGAKGDIGEQGSAGPDGATGPAGSTGSTGVTGAMGPAGPMGLTGPEGAQGQVGPSGADGVDGADGADAVSAFAQFFALAPPDNAATVAPGTNVFFPQDGPSSLTITRIGPEMINLPDVGTYRVSFSVPVSENGQLVVVLNGSDLPYTVVGRATGTSTIAGESLVQTTVPNSLLSVGNPAGNPSALTITPLAGGARPVAATLIIEQLG